jgi:polyisoprenoid-binding protein YceI
MKKLLLTLLAASAATLSHAAPYAIDPLHTNVNFEIDHGLSTNRGRFDKKEGTVEFDPQAKTGSVSITIDTTSLSTSVPALARALQGKNAFDVEQFPTAKFVADNFVFAGDKVVEVNGNLTMLGKTNPVKLKAIRFGCETNAALKRETCGGDFETTIMRSAWGMNFGLPRFPDNVKLLLQVEAIRQ